MKMEEEREKDIRIPLIFSTFCVLVLAGGVFLVIYVFIPHISLHWFPYAAFILIGSPWIFWIFTYIYTCFKPCCHRHPSQRLPPPATPALPELTTKSPKEESQVNTPSGERRVRFGEVVVMDDEKVEGRNGNLEGPKEEGEIEKPLAS